MTEADAQAAAERADLIVNGFAYTKRGDGIAVLDLRTGKAAVLTAGHEVSETSMDDMDLALALRYLSQNERFLEKLGA